MYIALIKLVYFIQEYVTQRSYLSKFYKFLDQPIKSSDCNHEVSVEEIISDIYNIFLTLQFSFWMHHSSRVYITYRLYLEHKLPLYLSIKKSCSLYTTVKYEQKQELHSYLFVSHLFLSNIEFFTPNMFTAAPFM